METLKINPTLIHGFYRDFSAPELARIHAALQTIPGEETGRAEIWGKFSRDEATMFYGRLEKSPTFREPNPPMAFFVFFELRAHRFSAGQREFFVEAGTSFYPSHDLTEAVFPQLERIARLLDCQSLSFRTGRAGLVKKVLKMPGWCLAPVLEDDEFLLRKSL